MNINLLPAYAEVIFPEDMIRTYRSEPFALGGYYSKNGSVYTYMGEEPVEGCLRYSATIVWKAPSGKLYSLGGNNTESTEWKWSIIPLLERIDDLETRLKDLYNDVHFR
jgi:hypothetical protein